MIVKGQNTSDLKDSIIREVNADFRNYHLYYRPALLSNITKRDFFIISNMLERTLYED